MAEDNHSHGASAASKTVTLSVPGLNCGACPITIKKALTRLSGVSKANVNYEETIVIIDHAGTDVDALLEATDDAGYLFSVKE